MTTNAYPEWIHAVDPDAYCNDESDEIQTPSESRLTPEARRIENIPLQFV